MHFDCIKIVAKYKCKIDQSEYGFIATFTAIQKSFHCPLSTTSITSHLNLLWSMLSRYRLVPKYGTLNATFSNIDMHFQDYITLNT